MFLFNITTNYDSLVPVRVSILLKSEILCYRSE